jgi:hypothetical protein
VLKGPVLKLVICPFSLPMLCRLFCADFPPTGQSSANLTSVSLTIFTWVEGGMGRPDVVKKVSK